MAKSGLLVISIFIPTINFLVSTIRCVKICISIGKIISCIELIHLFCSYAMEIADTPGYETLVSKRRHLLSDAFKQLASQQSPPVGPPRKRLKQCWCVFGHHPAQTCSFLKLGVSRNIGWLPSLWRRSIWVAWKVVDDSFFKDLKFSPILTFTFT